MRILIVEDDVQLAQQLSRTLEEQRYTVNTARDGEEALDLIFDQPCDLIILDIMLPKRDGLSVLQELRQPGIQTQALMLTARGETDDRIQGLDLGADDYVGKPFSLAELLARARALLRRGSDQAQPVLEVRDIRLNTITREVTSGKKKVPLTPKEFSLLEFLLYNTNRAVSRLSLAEHVWGEEFDPFTMSNSIDVHIKNLRKKIGDADSSIVQTVRSVGYIIRDETS